MIFSYNWLKDYIKKLPKPEKLAQILTMHSFEVEEVKKVGKDYVLDIDILPNRGPDCFSHIGIAREIAAVLALKFKLKDIKIKENEKKTKDFISVNAKDDCIRYTAKVITDVKVGSSPKWIQERLKVCGLRSINNIVDAANYVMLETGQPLHAFDLDKIEGKKIIVRRAKKGEKIISLDNQRYNLDSDILVIADAKNPLAIAGIKGGKKAEIDKKTKTIVLESANFDSRVVRRGSQKLGLKTDASWRFEHGLDPNLTELAINRVAKLIQEIAKGKVASGLVDFYPKKVLPKKIKLDLKYVEKLLGKKIPKKEIKRILESLGFKYKGNIVEVPTFRLDISLQEDLIEEIGRIYGYEKISAAFPVACLIPPKRNFEIFWENMTKDILKELGFTEVYNYSFINEEQTKVFKGAIEIENPMSKEQKYLRPSLIPNLLKNIKENLKHFKEIKIFELGKIFDSQGEKQMLTGATSDSFYQAKGAVDTLLNKLGISDIYYDEYHPGSFWQKGKCAEIKVSGEKIGCLGQISADRDRVSVVVFDIDFEELAKLCSEEHEYQPISQYPAAVRDLAILVPIDIKVVDVLNKINIAGGALVRDVDLFDIYEGESIGQGKKNLAFHIIYQAEDRTLSTQEINKMQDKIIKALESEPAWQVRRQ